MTLNAGNVLDIDAVVTATGSTMDLDGKSIDIDANVIAAGTTTLDASDGSIDIAASSRLTNSSGNITMNAAGAIGLGDGAAGQETVTNSGSGNISITTTSAGNLTIDDDSILIGDGTLTINAAGNFTIATTNASTQQIDSDGDISITANGVGLTQTLDITGDGGGDRTLTVSNTSTSGERTAINVVTDQFSSVVLTQADANTSADIDFTGVDDIDIDGGDTSVTLESVVLTAADINFEFDLTEAQNVVVKTVTADTAGATSTISIESSGNVTINSGSITAGGAVLIEADEDIIVGSGAATNAIDASGGAYNVFLKADLNNGGTGEITDNAGIIKMGTGALLLSAGDGVGATGTGAIETVGVTDFAAEANSGGIFLNNSTSGAINITTVDGQAGVTTVAGAISITNAATQNIKVAQVVTAGSGGVTLNAGNVLDIDAVVTATGSTMDLDGKSIDIDANVIAAGTTTLDASDGSIDIAASSRLTNSSATSR